MLHGPSAVHSVVLLLTKLKTLKTGEFQLLREDMEGHFPITEAIDFESSDC